jgi:hypothetical protein
LARQLRHRYCKSAVSNHHLIEKGNLMRRALLLACVGLGLAAPVSAVTFTGNVPTDFATVTAYTAMDGLGDVGISPNAPAGTVSGWDIHFLAFEWNAMTAELEIGIAFSAIAGDADGDGGEGTTSPWLAGYAGTDIPNLGLTESICMALDLDFDGAYDIIAGVDSNGPGHQVAVYNHDPSGINWSFGADASSFDHGSFYGHDVEFRIGGLENYATDAEYCIGYSTFAGSLEDDGIGEDYANGSLCFPNDEVFAELPTGMNLLSAYPNPFNPTTTLQVDLAQTGIVDLAVYNLNGQLVSTVVSGMLEAGSHALNFNASALPSGLYLARLATDQGIQVERLLLAK